MIITRTPFRLCLAGSGTDFPDFYRKSSGAAVSMAVNKYAYLALCNSQDEILKFRKFLDKEKIRNLNAIEQRLLAAASKRYGVDCRNVVCANKNGIGIGNENTAAFSVGLLQLIHACKKEYPSQETIAEEAFQLEVEILKNTSGKQEYYGSAIGGINFFEFLPEDTVCSTPIFLRPEEKNRLENDLLKFCLGLIPEWPASHEIDRHRKSREKNFLSILELAADLARRLKEEIGNSVDILGEFLSEEWELKQRLISSNISPGINAVIEKAMAAGASGATLAGQGKESFLLVYTMPEKQSAVIDSLKQYPLHKVKIDDFGATIIFDDRTSK